MSATRWSRLGEWGLLVGLVLAAGGILWSELRPPQLAARTERRQVAVTVANVAGAGSTNGPFRLASAAVLTSADGRFGGLSGLAALADGQLLAITDAGDWLLWRPGSATGEMGAIAMPGRDKADRDSEAVALTPDGRTLVSLEQQHRILAFAGQGPPVGPVGEPLYRTDTMGWPPNGGGESLAVLPDGQLVWIAENARAVDGALTAQLIAGDGKTRTIVIDPVAGFSPTDATALDDRHLIVLHRQYNGAQSAAAITVVDLAPVLAGGSAAPARLLARWGRGGSWPIDNMEGLALVRRPGRLPLLYLVSDDNFSAVQRTLVLQLEVISPLVDATSTRTGARCRAAIRCE